MWEHPCWLTLWPSVWHSLASKLCSPKIHQLNYPVQTRSHSGHYQGCWWADWFRGVQGWFRISTTFSMLIAILLLSGDPVWGGGDVQPALHCQHAQSGPDSCTALLSFLLFSQNLHHNMDGNFFDNSLSFYFKVFFTAPQLNLSWSWPFSGQQTLLRLNVRHKKEPV